MSAALIGILAMVSGARTDTYDEEIAAAITDVEHVFPVPAALVKAVIQQESGFNPQAVSRAGAIGLMQVMPFNAERLGLTREDLWHPARNILAGVRLLAVLLRHYDGDVVSALVAYNARPRPLGAPLPDNGETPGYVAAVLAYYREHTGRDLLSGRSAFTSNRAPVAGRSRAGSSLARSPRQLIQEGAVP